MHATWDALHMVGGGLVISETTSRALMVANAKVAASMSISVLTIAQSLLSGRGSLPGSSLSLSLRLRCCLSLSSARALADSEMTTVPLRACVRTLSASILEVSDRISLSFSSTVNCICGHRRQEGQKGSSGCSSAGGHGERELSCSQPQRRDEMKRVKEEGHGPAPAACRPLRRSGSSAALPRAEHQPWHVLNAISMTSGAVHLMLCSDALMMMMLCSDALMMML